MSVSPPGQRRRKARDLNPHGLSAARFSKPARQPVSGYPPYRVDPAGVEPALPARQAGVVPLDHRPMQPVRGVGVEPTLSGSQGRRITAFLPPVSCGPPENRTPISALRRRRLPVGRAAPQRSGRESNPVFRAYQGGVRPQHFQTSQLRRPDSNRRGTAYETVLGTRLQSTPQYPRQDSNLRSPPSQGGAVAAGLRG